MTHVLACLMRRLASHAARALCTGSGRLAIVVGIAAAIASSAQAAAAPFEAVIR